MINHGEKCKHCDGPLTEPKPVSEGPRKGQTQAVCSKCGHINYLSASPQPKIP
jgi:RNase P subunit RPR2